MLGKGPCLAAAVVLLAMLATDLHSWFPTGHRWFDSAIPVGCGSSSSSAQTSLCDGGEAGGSRVRQRVVVARKRRRDRCPTVLVPSATAGGFPLVLARFVESFSTHQSAGCPWPLEDRQSRTACRQALR